MNKKVIGIPGYKSKDDSSYGAGVNHLEFISKFGYPRIIMPWEEDTEIDALYLPGGLDLSPSSYGAIPRYNTSNQDVFKEFFFKQRLENYVQKQIPIIGICLGMQQLGVYFGSKLTQDLIFHAQSDSRWATAHDLFPADRINRKVGKVNSHHHQGILLKDLSGELIPLYLSENEDKDLEESLGNTDCGHIVEVFRHASLPILGFQYHPEEFYDSLSIDLIKDLLKL
jgi:gamma-glutamyl-gamma-aminobutyrate hydrolase PuuD